MWYALPQVSSSQTRSELPRLLSEPLHTAHDHEAARRCAAAIHCAGSHPKSGRPTLFLPDEERLLLEMAALHAEQLGRHDCIA